MNLSSRRLKLLGLFSVVFAVFAWADIWSLVLSGGDYTPFSASSEVSSVTYDESQLYAPGPMRFMRGGEVSTEVDVPELAHLPNGFPTLHVWLIGTLAKAMGSLEWAWMLSHGLFPSCVFLGFMFWFRQQKTSLTVAAACAAVTCLLPMGPRNALMIGQDTWLQPLELTRTPQPSLALAVLLLWAISLSACLKSAHGQRWLLAAVAFSSLFYAYYFMWIAACFATAVLGLLLFTTRQWKLLVRLIAVSSAGFVGALPYLLRATSGIPATTALGGARSLMERVGEFHRGLHLFPCIAGVLLLVALVTAYHYCRHQQQNYLLWLAGSLVIAGVMGLNLHVITGYDAQHEHFNNRIIQPFLFCLFVCVLIGSFSTLVNGQKGRAIALGVLAICLLSGFTRQTVVAARTLPMRLASNARNDALLWVRQHVTPDQVAGSLDEQLLTLIPSAAGVWNFVPLGDRSMADSKEILLRYCCVAKLLNLEVDEVVRRLKADDGRAKNSASTGYVLVMQRPIRESSLEWVRQNYEKLDLRDALRSRRLDYLLVGVADYSRGAVANANMIWRNRDWVVMKVMR